jgi:hypothetical protein
MFPDWLIDLIEAPADLTPKLIDCGAGTSTFVHPNSKNA